MPVSNELAKQFVEAINQLDKDAIIKLIKQEPELLLHPFSTEVFPELGVGPNTVFEVLVKKYNRSNSGQQYVDITCAIFDKIAEGKINKEILKSIAIHKFDDNWSILHLAAWANHAEAISMLLEQDADPKNLNKAGYSALGLARAKQHEAVAKLLEQQVEEKLRIPLEIGFDPDVECTVTYNQKAREFEYHPYTRQYLDSGYLYNDGNTYSHPGMKGQTGRYGLYIKDRVTQNFLDIGRARPNKHAQMILRRGWHNADDYRDLDTGLIFFEACEDKEGKIHDTNLFNGKNLRNNLMGNLAKDYMEKNYEVLKDEDKLNYCIYINDYGKITALLKNNLSLLLKPTREKNKNLIEIYFGKLITDYVEKKGLVSQKLKDFCTEMLVLAANDKTLAEKVSAYLIDTLLNMQKTISVASNELPGRPAINQTLYACLKKQDFKLANLALCSNEAGYTWLHIAALLDNDELAKQLIALNVNQEARTNEGKTALDIAKKCKHNDITFLLENASIVNKETLQNDLEKNNEQQLIAPEKFPTNQTNFLEINKRLLESPIELDEFDTAIVLNDGRTYTEKEIDDLKRNKCEFSPLNRTPLDFNIQIKNTLFLDICQSGSQHKIKNYLDPVTGSLLNEAVILSSGITVSLDTALAIQDGKCPVTGEKLKKWSYQSGKEGKNGKKVNSHYIPNYKIRDLVDDYKKQIKLQPINGSHNPDDVSNNKDEITVAAQKAVSNTETNNEKPKLTLFEGFKAYISELAQKSSKQTLTDLEQHLASLKIINRFDPTERNIPELLALENSTRYAIKLSSSDNDLAQKKSNLIFRFLNEVLNKNSIAEKIKILTLAINNRDLNIKRNPHGYSEPNSILYLKEARKRLGKGLLPDQVKIKSNQQESPVLLLEYSNNCQEQDIKTLLDEKNIAYEKIIDPGFYLFKNQKTQFILTLDMETDAKLTSLKECGLIEEKDIAAYKKASEKHSNKNVALPAYRN